LLNGGLEGYERAIPKALQISTQGSQPTRVELVDAVLAGAPVDDQARVFQHLEVLRDRRAAHGELVRQLVYSPRAFGEALAPWVARRPVPGPPPITDPVRLRQLVGIAGLTVTALDEVDCAFDYPDEDELVGPVLGSGIGRHALNRAGPKAVRAALLDRLADHRRADGGYRLVNRFRVLTAARPPAGADGLATG